MTEIYLFLFFISAILNVFLYLKFKDLRTKLEESKTKPKPSYTAEQLLHDLTRGPAIIKIECISPADIFLRSPREV